MAHWISYCVANLQVMSSNPVHSCVIGCVSLQSRTHYHMYQVRHVPRVNTSSVLDEYFFLASDKYLLYTYPFGKLQFHLHIKFINSNSNSKCINSKSVFYLTLFCLLHFTMNSYSEYLLGIFSPNSLYSK